MKVNLKLCVFTLIYTGVITPGFAWATDVEDFVARLKTHYHHTSNIQAFSLSHHYLNKRYRGLNYTNSTK